MFVKDIALQVAMASLSLCAVAGTKVWVGESGGLWGEASNWSPSGVPGYSDVVVFRPAGEMVVENKTISTCGGMRFESGNVLLYSSANRIYLNTGTNEIYVAPGITACVSNAVVSKGSDPRATPKKTGTGTLVIRGKKDENWGNDWGKMSAFDFAEGVTEFRCAGTVQFGRPITIRSGATVKSPKDYAFHASNTPITIEEGGVLDLDGASTVYMAGLNGAGVVTNVSTISSVRLVGGPYRFSGKIYPKQPNGKAVFSIASRADSSATEDEWKQYVCSSDAFANVQFQFPSSSTGGCPLCFAAGIGTFNIKEIQGNDKTHLVLEDEDGLPVTVNTSYSNLLKLRLKGSGTLRNSYSGYSSYGSTVDLSLFTGTFVQASGDFTLGNGTAANWPVLNPAMRIENVGAGSFNFKPSSDGTVIAGEIAGTGTYLFYGKATLQAFNPVGSWVQLRADSDLTIAGGYAQIASWGIYMYSNSKLSVTNGAYVGGLDTRPDSSFRSLLRHPYGAPLTKGNAAEGSLDVSAGGVLDTQGSVPHVTRVHDGGVLRLSGGPEATGTAGSPGVWTFDGGTLEANNIVTAYNQYLTPESDGVKVVVGKRGMTLNLDVDIYSWHDGYNKFHIRKPFYGADGGDGGVVRTGAGVLLSYAPHAIAGSFSSLDGRIMIPNKSAVTTATTPLFGTGDFVLGNSRIDFDGDISSAFTTRIGTGGQFVYAGASTFRVRESSARPVQTIQLGELARGGRGAAMFFLDQTSGAEYNDSGANLTTTVAPETDADGRVKAPVFVVACPANYSGGHVRFASYSAGSGLKAFDGETEGVGGGVSKAAKVTAQKATVASDASVAALRVDGISSVNSYPDGGDAQLWISSGATLTVGDGVNPGVVVLNNNRTGWTPAAIRGEGTLDFGANEGVIVCNEKCNGYNAAIYCRVAGSGGVSFVKPIATGAGTSAGDLSRASVELYGTNTWTGGTFVNGVRVAPKNPRALSSGMVTLGAGNLASGELAMTVGGLEVANAVRASGWGISERGAVNFEADGRVSGAFEVSGSVRVHAVNGVRGEFSGPVSGGKLVVHGSWYTGVSETNGVIVLSNPANSYTGGTYVVRTTLALKGSGSAGAGTVTLDGGTLRIENDEARTVSNTIRGVGRIQLAGRGEVGFSSFDSQDGVGFTLDLGARVTTVASLGGFSSITTGRALPTHLVVVDGNVDGFSGDVPANVTLHAYRYDKPGTVIVVQ